MEFDRLPIVKKQDHEINYSLNIIKCIAIFAIICIHCGFYNVSSIGSVIDALSRFAVPIFFLISGFFSYYENENYAISKYRMRIIRLVKLYIIAILAYINFYLLIGQLTGLNDVISLFSLNKIWLYVVFNETPVGSFLWFIPALLYCYILFYIIKKLNFNIINRLYVFIPILLIGNLLLGEFSQYMGLTIPIYVYRNFLFVGLPFFTLGYFIHDNKGNITGVLSNYSLIIIMVLSLIFTTIETFVVGKHDLYLGSIIFVVCLFIWCVKNPNRLNFKITGWIGKNIYAHMYILHIMVLILIGKCGLELGYIKPIIVFVITALISGVIYEVMKNLIKST